MINAINAADSRPTRCRASRQPRWVSQNASTQTIVTAIWYLVSRPTPSTMPRASHQRSRGVVQAFQHSAALMADTSISTVLWFSVVNRAL